jgi:hypothetical protein|tara:strand:- start:2941 stop:3138 length:198 start_codon:yes stop_codon:yes gene_type:complete
MEKLIFQTHPIVDLGTNLFINCSTILQFDDVLLVQVVPVEKIGFSTSIPIYHQDGMLKRLDRSFI